AQESNQGESGNRGQETPPRQQPSEHRLPGRSGPLALDRALDLAPVKLPRLRDGRLRLVSGQEILGRAELPGERAGFRVGCDQFGYVPGFLAGKLTVDPGLHLQKLVLVHVNSFPLAYNSPSNSPSSVAHKTAATLPSRWSTACALLFLCTPGLQTHAKSKLCGVRRRAGSRLDRSEPATLFSPTLLSGSPSPSASAVPRRPNHLRAVGSTRPAGASACAVGPGTSLSLFSSSR